jgi:hypothetical protein
MMTVRQPGGNVAELKRKLIPQYRDAARQYRTIIDRHAIIDCEDGYAVDILFEKQNFMHLCGVWCDRPPEIIHAGKTTEAEFFYDQLLKGRLPSNAIHYADPRRTRRKASVIADAIGFASNATMVVDSRKQEVVCYLGNESWCLGLGERDIDSQYCAGKVFYPKSLRSQSVGLLRREGTEPHTILSVRFRH